MQFGNWKRVRQFLRLGKVINLYKSIFDLFKPAVLYIELPCNPVMRVTIKLKSERRPGWYAQITQPEIFIDKIKIVMQAAARIIFAICFAFSFISSRMGAAHF